MTSTTIKRRDPSIDILKCLAALLITHSHMEILYPHHLTSLATGGAIGDVLFFFCSGYTLFLGQQRDFPNWYKRRINRIYPTVFMWALVSAVLFSSTKDMESIVLSGGGWFVSCIMIYYVILWFIRRFFIKKLTWVFAFFSAIVLAWYVLFEDSREVFMYGNTYFKWVHYFLFMLLGACLGLKRKANGFEMTVKPKVIPTLLKIIGCVILFYGLQIFGKHIIWVAHLQILTLIPLMGITYWLFMHCNTQGVLNLYARKWPHRLIYWIGALCLEIYLCQTSLFTDKMNGLFPLNMLIMFVVIFVFAYGVKVLSNWFSQTFRTEPYDWNAMIKL